jgi:hypothetical protein
MSVKLGTSSGIKELVDPKIGASGVRRDVQEIWLGQGGAKKLVWVRQLPAVDATALAWDRARLAITPPGSGVDSYVVKRNGAPVPNPPAGTGSSLAPFTWDDTGLSPSTAYTYVVEATRAGVPLRTATDSITTPARADMGLTKGTVTWDTVPLTWTDSSGGSIDSYTILRDGVEKYSGTSKAFTDTGLMPSTTYAYTLQAKRSGAVISTDTLSATTSAYADLGLTATAAAYNQINLAWAAKNGSVDSFELKRGSTVIYTGAGTSKSDTGLAESTAYTYTLTAKRGTTTIKTDTASATTPARPTSSGTVSSPAQCSGCYQWKQSSAATTSSSFTMPVSAYVSSIDMLVSGYGATGRVDPYVNGVYKGERDLAGTGTGSPGWNSMAMGNQHLPAASGYTCGFRHVNSGAYKTQWGYYSAGGSNSVCFTLHYWYYTSLLRTSDTGEQEYERPTHTDICLGPDGQVVCEKVYDKQSGRLLSQVGEEPGCIGCGGEL